MKNNVYNHIYDNIIFSNKLKFTPFHMDSELENLFRQNIYHIILIISHQHTQELTIVQQRIAISNDYFLANVYNNMVNSSIIS